MPQSKDGLLIEAGASLALSNCPERLLLSEFHLTLLQDEESGTVLALCQDDLLVHKSLLCEHVAPIGQVETSVSFLKRRHTLAEKDDAPLTHEFGVLTADQVKGLRAELQNCGWVR